MKTYEIWSEGYQCTGDSNGAQYLGKAEAAIWGCRLFDNEADARKSFG